MQTPIPALDDWRAWILTRMEQMRIERESRQFKRLSKKARWHMAHQEWVELRWQQRRVERQARAAAELER
jgi:hypothetical protein